MFQKITILLLATLLIGVYSFTKFTNKEKGIIKAYKGSHIDKRFSSGPPVGKTGAPDEGRCTDCHGGVATENSTANKLTLFNAGTTTVVTTYEPGKMYDAQLVISGAGSKNGFQTTARILASNLTAGTLLEVAGSTQRLKQGAKEFIDQVTASNTGNTFNFKWVAPGSGTGDVRFYLASNIANNNGSPSGDAIHLSEFTFTEKVAAAPVADFTASATTVCAGETVSFTNTSTGDPTSFSWTFEGGTPASSTSPNPTVTYSTGGSHAVTFVATNAGGSSTKQGTITVTALPVITQGAVTNPAACGEATGSIEITGTGTGDLTWSGSASGSMIAVTLPTTITALTAGSYDFAFASSGCTSSLLTVSLSDPGSPATPTVTSSDADNTICEGESITLTSSAATGNVWSNGATTETITVTTSGSYTVLISENGCSSFSSNPIAVVVNAVPAKPMITSSDADNVICLGTETLTLSSSQAASYAWSSGEQSQDVVVSTSGTFAVTVTENGCTSVPSDSVTVVAEVCLGVDDNELDLLLIYPNPTANALTLEGKDLNQFSTVLCVDATGKISGQWAINATGSQTLDLSAIANGTYQIVLKSKDLMYKRTIQVQH